MPSHLHPTYSNRHNRRPENRHAEAERLDHTCPICRVRDPERRTQGTGKDTWCIDHDHETGKVRGYVCFSCNLALHGQLTAIDPETGNAERLRRALAYVEHAAHNDFDAFVRVLGPGERASDYPVIVGAGFDPEQHPAHVPGVTEIRRDGDPSSSNPFPNWIIDRIVT